MSPEGWWDAEGGTVSWTLQGQVGLPSVFDWGLISFALCILKVAFVGSQQEGALPGLGRGIGIRRGGHHAVRPCCSRGSWGWGLQRYPWPLQGRIVLRAE